MIGDWTWKNVKNVKNSLSTYRGTSTDHQTRLPVITIFTRKVKIGKLLFDETRFFIETIVENCFTHTAPDLRQAIIKNSSIQQNKVSVKVNFLYSTWSIVLIVFLDLHFKAHSFSVCLSFILSVFIFWQVDFVIRTIYSDLHVYHPSSINALIVP